MNRREALTEDEFLAFLASEEGVRATKELMEASTIELSAVIAATLSEDENHERNP